MALVVVQLFDKQHNKPGHLAVVVQTLDSTPGGTQQMFIRGDSAPRSNFYIPFFTTKIPLSYIPSIDIWYPFHIPRLERKCTVF